MTYHAAFDLVREEKIDDIHSLARHYRHKKTGAEVVSLVNDDENKVFGITFKTPPDDSTGIAHILEHSVLCGSRKYPVKKPFVELLKGSMHSFLNAMTFPDKTAYPVASQNLADFYNLVDVYLDSVLFPLISEDTFRQEGWHYELENKDAPLTYKGVVFNEMKGAWSSPDAVMHKTAQSALYPDTTYGKSSGGDPVVMPELTYEKFKRFHQTYYHPSNARAFFSGDDDPQKRLDILDAYFSQFEQIDVDATIDVQGRFNEPRQIAATYPGSIDGEKRRDGMVTVNWMINAPADREEALANGVLSYVLAGTSASPLRKALTDSGLGEGLMGGGIQSSLMQPMATFGLKGVEPENAGKVEALILDTLRDLASNGIDPKAIEAALNTFEFSLREGNTGSFPRGLAWMFGALSTWLYESDPLDALQFEDALAAIKEKAGSGYLEALIRKYFLENMHRVTVTLTADEEQGSREEAQEAERLAKIRQTMSDADLEEIIETSDKLRALQESVDDPKDLAKIPSLTRADLRREIRTVPSERGEIAGAQLFTHDLTTLGILYLDLGFDLHALDAELLPYMPLFGRALLQMGTSTDDFVGLTQRIGRSTGGIAQHRAVSARQGGDGTAAWFFLSGKAVGDKVDEMLAILRDVLLDARLDNQPRFKQMVLEEKAGFEARLVPAGNGIVDLRLKSSLTEAGAIAEITGGIEYLGFLRDLAKRVDSDWDAVRTSLERIRALLINRAKMVVNVSTEPDLWQSARPSLEAFLKDLPMSDVATQNWDLLRPRVSEGLTIPAQVNYVGKGANLKALGHELTGASRVILKYLNTTYLWDKIRVQGGAYGGSGRFDPVSGNFSFLSYRDPNILKSLDAYDGAAKALRAGIGAEDLTRSMIGVIGDMDPYQFPDAKGYGSMWRQLTGTTDALRQQRRDEVLATSNADVAAMAEALESLSREGHVVVLGNAGAIEKANAERDGLLEISKVM
ncbi:peptidase M16 [Devosia pacifica]|uniref:Peptidase M16 n=1 Tax=Devosia pacifica TaxID=1335967 RepID=A0A918SGJ4_9HYPH|nr:insulinase family protein [Devosia pacifica]GHA37671.1 peptidase M16 [Devosia pacifica]